MRLLAAVGWESGGGVVGRVVWGACLFLPLFCLDRLAIKLKVLCTHVALQVKSSDGQDKCPRKGGHDHTLAHLHTCRSSVAAARERERERGKATHCRRKGGDSHPELLVELALHLDGRLFDKHLGKMSSLSPLQTKADSQSTPVVFGTEGGPGPHLPPREQQLSPQPQEVHVKASSVRNPSFNLASEPRIWA